MIAGIELDYDVNLDKLIGAGGQGEVYLAERKRDKLPVAIKVTPRSRLKPGPEGCPLELAILARMQEVDGVVKLIDHRFVGQGNLALIMERLEGPDLFDYIQCQESAMDEDIAHCLFKQVLLTVPECHKRGVVHRYIKDKNIVFDHTNHLKIIDFGGAAFLDVAANGKFTSFGGTPELAPPEWFTEHAYRAEPHTA